MIFGTKKLYEISLRYCFKSSTLFMKNVGFPVQTEYSYFLADFRLKTFLYYSKIIAYEISVLECIGV